MAAKKPSPGSPKRSSAERSRAGSAPPEGRSGRARPAAPATLLAAADSGSFPVTLYLDGPDEPLKAALLADLRRAWAASCPEAPAARVLRAAESGVDEILAAFHGSSLFSPRELVVVLDIEDLGRSEKRVEALAAGLRRPSGGTSLILVESAAESPRKSLEGLRSACAARWSAFPLDRRGLLEWGRRRLAAADVQVSDETLAAATDASEGDAGVLFNELDKLAAWAGPGGTVSNPDAQRILRPVAGADLAALLAAAAAGDPGLATRSLGRVLAGGVGEGSVLFALSNLVSGALGGWARHRELSDTLRRRCSPRALARALDALYRAETAWKGGRADVTVVLEQATREVCAPATAG